MKKIFFSASALALLMFTSCKKDYTCECTASLGGFATINLSSETITDTKKNAKEECEEKEDEPLNFNGIPIPVEDTDLNLKPSCSIKE